MIRREKECVGRPLVDRWTRHRSLVWSPGQELIRTLYRVHGCLGVSFGECPPMDDRYKEYQGFVDQCEGMAETETDPERKRLWRSLADRWRKKIHRAALLAKEKSGYGPG